MILSQTDLPSYRRQAALVDGAFDPLHEGHLTYFHAARSWLDYHHFAVPLICNIAPDTYVAQKHSPLLPADERAAIINALRVIDGVIVGPTLETLCALQPTHYIKGAAWDSRLPADLLATCRNLGIAIKHVTTGLESLSSSDMLKRHQERTTQKALATLEAFIQHQGPSKPWVPTVDYSFEARRRDEGKRPQLIAEVFRPSSVLDYGCGHGHLVTLLRERGIDAVGYDPDPKAPGPYIAKYASRCGFPLVICREVFEHVSIREWTALVGRLCALSTEWIYVTTRFHPDSAHLLDVTKDGHREIDPTEITFATRDLLALLFILQGWRRDHERERCFREVDADRCLVFHR